MKHFKLAQALLIGVVMSVSAQVPEGAASQAAPVARIDGDNLELEISADGYVIRTCTGTNHKDRVIKVETLMAGCRRDGSVMIRKLEDGSVTAQSHMVQIGGNHSCRLTERFVPTSNSIRWELDIRGDGEPWSTGILTQVGYPASSDTRYWTAWSDPGQVNRPWFKGGGWTDPLTVMPLKDATFDYGAPAYNSENPRIGWCPFDGNLICLPLVSLLEPGGLTGFSLILSPEDASREITLLTTATGRFTFSRACHRIDARRSLKFAMDMVAHEASWRGSLRWMTGRYPAYFDPPNPVADDLAGTAAYSCQDVDFDVEKMRKMAFRVNWRASFDFPYMGMFIPPLAESETWSRFGGRQTSLALMRDYCAKMRQRGFYVLSYFNVDEFGAKVTWPLPPPKAATDANVWENCLDFLSTKLPDAIMLIPDRTSAKALATCVYPASRPGGPYLTWEDGIVLDCGEPAYREFLLDQARRHIDQLPQSSGICIDRLDWLRLYNERADDGESWFEGRPARSLMASWNDLMARLGPAMHDAGKVVFVNNHVKRIDLLRHVDGILDEFTYTGAPLNLTALLTLRKTALGWVDDESSMHPDPDVFFQRYLHLGVYPMAPFPGNDHSLRPSEWVDRQYLSYGPLLDAMRGKKWVLEPDCVATSLGGAKVNLFKVPGGYALPVTFGGAAPFATVTLRNLPELGRLRCEALVPGGDPVVVVSGEVRGDVLTLKVPLKHGCAMVRLRQ